MEERISKIISSAGVASRRQAEIYITQGRVKVNGKLAVLGQKANLDSDYITVDEKPLKPLDDRVYIALNKPVGYVTTLKDENGRKTVADLTSDVGFRIYPVGRLDMDSEGLLIMTNDGEIANKLMHPKYNVMKTYHVTVSPVTGLDLASKRLSEEMIIDGFKISPARVKILERDLKYGKLSVTIGEGRNRQVRKMCAQVGLCVHRLRRISIGEITLKGLSLGKWRFLNSNEKTFLMEL